MDDRYLEYSVGAPEYSATLCQVVVLFVKLERRPCVLNRVVSHSLYIKPQEIRGEEPEAELALILEAVELHRVNRLLRWEDEVDHSEFRV